MTRITTTIKPCNSASLVNIHIFIVIWKMVTYVNRAGLALYHFQSLQEKKSSEEKEIYALIFIFPVFPAAV